MGFTKPRINEVTSDIKNVSIYLRSVKKWGKSTLFRDVIRAKYNDLTRGVLVECGLENGDTMLNANMVHLDTYKEFMEFKKWLIETKGVEHNIEMVCFDTADELVPIFETEAVRRFNSENPTKKQRSVRGIYGGYNAGIEMVAGMIKQYISEIKQAGFGVWVIAHTKFKTIREKGGLEEDGYMQLTSNLVNAYESAFGDIFDATLTGVIDRVFDEKTDGKTKKKYTTDSIRKLYFRGTPLIDAGGRFASNTVPEFMEYDTDSFTFAKDFIKIVEDGLEGSKIDVPAPTFKSKAVTKTPDPDPIDEDDLDSDTSEDITADEDTFDIEAYRDEIRTKFKASKDKEVRDKVREILAEKCGKKLDNADKDVLDEINAIL